MRSYIKRWCLVAGLILLLLPSLSIAQEPAVILVEPESSEDYLGIGLGFVYFVPVLHTHYGFTDLIADNVDLRLGLDLFPYIYAFTAEVIYDAPPRTNTNLNFYGGGGAGIVFATSYGVGVGVIPVVNALGGIIIKLDSVDLFTELEADILLSPDTWQSGLPLAFVLRGGVNIPF